MTKQYNVNIVGSLTNTDGVLSGFTTSNYATLPSAFTPNSDTWEIAFKFTTSNDVTTEQTILGNRWRYYGGSYSQQWGVFLTILNGVLNIEACKGQEGYGDNPVFVQHSTNVSVNTTYTVRFIYNGSAYASYISVGSGTESLLQSTSSNNIITADNTYLPTLGLVYAQHNGEYFNVFGGSIDLNSSYIKINNSTVWQGVTITTGTKIQLRHDTAANWTSVNPILLEGEVGLETDTGKSKVGDGSTAWNSLAYDLGSTALQSISSSNVTTALGYTPVNKTGDTMTGSLKFNNIGLETIVLQNIGTGNFSDIRFLQQNNNRVGHLRGNNVSSTSRNLQLTICNDSGSPASSLEIGYANGASYCKCEGGDSANSIVTTISKNKAQDGYFKLGNGLIIQWGFISQVSAGTGSILFSTAFSSSTSYSITSGLASSSATIYFTNASTTGINYTTSGTKKDYYWIAIGY